MSVVTRNSVEVAIRVRPLRPEIQETTTAWEFTQTTARERANPDSVFTFDRIYGVESTTQQLYQHSVRNSVVSRVVQGYNGTVFAYGQTGSGKTFTMFGEGRHDHHDPHDPHHHHHWPPDGQRKQEGLIELAVRDLFAALEREKQGSIRGSPSPPDAPSRLFPGDAAGSGRMRGYEVFLSLLEIYNEQLRDLLLPEGQAPKPLSIREGASGVYVHGALRTRVSSAEECLRAVYKHAGARVSASTAMNDRSSRSHCVIQVNIEKTLYLHGGEDDDDDDDDDDDGSLDDDNTEGEDARDGGEGTMDVDGEARSMASSSAASSGPSRGGGGTRGGGGPDRSALKGKQAARGLVSSAQSRRRTKKLISTLNLVDLAGSERVAKTGAVGIRMVEGGQINKSLMALTTVINRLAELSSVSGNGGGTERASPANVFVPYRDSRLTHLLKTSIGGNSLTCIFGCVTPASESVDESRSTMHFASRAKRIRNRVSVNEVMDPKARVRELEVELRRVKRQLVAQTIYLWSKSVTIKNLQTQLSAIVGDGLPSSSPSSSSFALSPSGGRRHVGPEGQRQWALAQLQARNEALEEELAVLRADGRIGSQAADSRGPGNVAEVQEAQHLNELCGDLEAKSGEQARYIKQLEDQVKEVEGLLDDIDAERASAVGEAELLRAQLQKTQAKLLQQGRGDAYLEELTRLHVEHQELQFHHNRLKESSQKRIEAMQGQVSAAQQKADDVEDQCEELKDKCKQLNAYLWRFLAVASLAGGGRVDTAFSATERPVPEKQVASALERLTMAIVGPSPPPGEASTPTETGADGDKEACRLLKAKVRELETQLLYKDSQRDVLVDTKLKRMQDLVLRLHAINNALVVELRQCYRDNDELFSMARDHRSLAAKLSKAGLYPRSLQSALERARLAEPVERPFGHN